MNIVVGKRTLIQGIHKINIEKLLEALCLAVVFLYFFSVWGVYDFNTSFREYRSLIAGVAITHILLVMAQRKGQAQLVFDLIFIFAFGRLLLICGPNTYVENLLNIFVLSLCMLGIEYKKALKTMSLGITATVFVGFVCAFAGIIDSHAREYARTYGDVTTTIIRSGWGSGHENGLGIRCFVAVACFCLGFNGFSKVLRSLVAFAAAYFVWIVPNSRFNACLLVLLGLGLLVDYLYDMWLHQIRIFKIARRGIEVILLILAALMPIFLIEIILNYERVNPELLQKLNSLSSGRIYLSYNGYLESGFSIWGQFYKSAYYLDSGWISIPIIYGIVALMFIIALLMYLGIKAIIKDDFLLVWLVLLTCISGICYEVGEYNIYDALLILPFAKCVNEKGETRTASQVETGKVAEVLYKNAVLVCTALVLASTFIFRKSIISILQTFVECKKYDSLSSVAWILIFIVLLVLLSIGLAGGIKAVLSHSRKTVAIGLILTSVLGLSFLFVYSGHYVNAIEDNDEVYDEILADADALKVLAGVEDIDLVPQMKPYLYKKYYGFTSLKWLPTADYARFDDVTVIVNARENYRTLYNTGFVQTPISDYHKIYTNDSRVIEAMEAAGYTFTYYSQYVKELDLDQYAKLNDLKQTEDGSLLVEASEEGKAIRQKSDDDFVGIRSDELQTFDAGGSYILHMVLEADATDLSNLAPETGLAHVVLQSPTDVYLDTWITCDSFVDGVAVCDIPFGLWGGETTRTNTTFTIDEAYTLDFSIKEISYYRTE